MKKNVRKKNNYIEGNVAPLLQPVSPGEEESYKKRRARKQEEQEYQRKRRRELQQIERFYRMDFLSFAFLLPGLIAALVICCIALSSQISVSQMKKDIASKELELSRLEKQNDSDLAEINASIDLRKIYKKATKKLGMVHASENQVIEYDSTKSDYVRQYGEIRKESER